MKQEFKKILLALGKSENTIRNYVYDIQRIEKTLNKDIETITIEDLQKYLSETENKPQTHSRRINALRTYFHTFKLPDITEGLEIKIRKQRPEIPDDEFITQLDKLYQEESNLQYKLCYMIMRQTGARVNEVLSLTAKDISEDSIIFRQKGGTYRLNPITHKLAELLQIEKRKKDKLFTISYLQFYRDFKRKVKKVSEILNKDYNYKVHSIRHYVATKLLHSGATIEEVRDLLGHKSITTTQIYTHSIARAKRDLINKLGGEL